MNLFKPIKIKSIILPNRVSVGSMCQYSADNGNPSLWHYGHLQNLALSGAGLLMLESTAVSMEGRISKKDLTLVNNKNFKNFLKLRKYLKSISEIPVGIQISHSGRKGSAHVPWVKSNTSLKKKI
jgi:2,4-dienoyl-CoA reductase-like NADH-dependent reductase (Old Yellow Enzyme family)